MNADETARDPTADYLAYCTSAGNFFGYHHGLPEELLPLAENEVLFRDFMGACYATFDRDVGTLSAERRYLVARAASLHGRCDRLDRLFVSGRTEQLRQEVTRSRGQIVPVGVDPPGFEPDAERADLVALLAANAGYNTLYKFRGLTEGRFDEFAARFKLKTFRATRFDLATVELLSVVVSALNACSPCVAAHVKKAKGRGVTYEQIDHAMQIAATVSTAVTFFAVGGDRRPGGKDGSPLC